MISLGEETITDRFDHRRLKAIVAATSIVEEGTVALIVITAEDVADQDRHMGEEQYVRGVQVPDVAKLMKMQLYPFLGVMLEMCRTSS